MGFWLPYYAQLRSGKGGGNPSEVPNQNIRSCMSFLTSWKDIVNLRWRSRLNSHPKCPSSTTKPRAFASRGATSTQRIPFSPSNATSRPVWENWKWPTKIRPLKVTLSQRKVPVRARCYTTPGSSVPPELAHKLREESLKSTNKAAPIFMPGAASGLIILTPQERKLVEFLKEAMSKMQCGAELRIAGGWVRDKLLGLGSGDVDIAVDLVSGEALSQILQDYIATLEPRLRHDIYGFAEASLDGSQHGSEQAPVEVPSVSVTKLNPQQSKHLETAIMRLFGLELNFAQLRTDVYDTQSRIPQIKSARPLEDAFRRDFTINSLFYNIMTDAIEDFTGKGISSLLEQSINTPLPPLETLRDDPLRALRAIRFAARFGFSIHSELLASIEDPSVHRLLMSKVTLPRIGVEVQKMLSPVVSGPPASESASFAVSGQPQTPTYPDIGLLEHFHENNPLQALQLLVSTNLHKIVFNVDSWTNNTSTSVWTKEITRRSTMLCYFLYHLFQVTDRHRAEVEQTVKPLQLSVLLTMTFLFPLLGHTYGTLASDAKRSAVVWLDTFKMSLQYPLGEVHRISRVLAESARLQEEIDAMCAGHRAKTPSDYVELFEQELRQDEGRRARIGIWLKNAPTFWRTLLLWSRLTRDSVLSQGISMDLSPDWISREFYRELALLDVIEKSQLVKARTLTPHFDGKEMQALLKISRGPLVGRALQIQLEYQVSHLDCTKEEVKLVLQAAKLKEGW